MEKGRKPLAVGAGGGGLGKGDVNDGQQHGKDMDVNLLGVTGSEYGNNSAGKLWISKLHKYSKLSTNQLP